MWKISILLVISIYITCNDALGIYNYYVSVENGNDKTGNGSKDNPFQTIQKSQQAVRNVIQTLTPNYDNNITVFIEPGEYTGPLNFGLNDFIKDSPDENNFVIYTGMNSNSDNPVLINGGFTLNNNWKWLYNISNRLSIYQTKLDTNQQSLLRNNEILQLFCNGTRMNLANNSMLYYEYFDTKTGTIQTNHSQIKYIKHILNTKNYLNTLYFTVFQSWTASIQKANKIIYDDNTGKINITLINAAVSYANSAPSGNRFFVMNNFYLLTDLYDFYYNSSTNVLYVVLPTNYQTIINSLTFTATNTIEVLTINGDISTNTKVKRLIFSNLLISYADIDIRTCLSSNCDDQSASYTNTSAVHLTASSNIYLDNVNITHIGGTAVYFDRGSYICSYINSYINDIGCGGIRIGHDIGGIVAINEIASNITIYNNYILNGGTFLYPGTGILAQGMSNVTISHNTIAHFKYIAISIGWTWSFISTTVENIYIGYNYVFDIGQFMLSDAGGIYTLGTQTNNIIENNVVFDIWTYNYGGEGIHIDQGSSNVMLRNNIVYNTKCSGYLQHYGLNNMIYNNIFAFVNVFNCAPNNAGGALTSNQQNCVCNTQNNNQSCCSSFYFLTNIIYINTTFNQDIFHDCCHTGLKNMTFNYNTYWSITEKNNITFPDHLTLNQWETEGKDINVTISDPQFVNPNQYNFKLQSTSPSLKMGFKQIDTTDVGPNW
eukprot:315842_1